MWWYLKAIKYTEVQAGRPILATLGVYYACLQSIHTPDQAEGSTDCLVSIQQGEPSLALGLPDQELASQPLGLWGDGQRLRA